MSLTIAVWLAELSTLPNMGEHVEELWEELHELYREGDHVPDAVELFDGIEWIAARQDKTPVERLKQVARLIKLDGRVILDMKTFTGWK
jgi:hypothetical protein